MPILNVEDHAPSRFLRSRILERAGFTVVEENTADAAVAKAVNGLPLPRLVLMDVGLPNGSGFDACERIKAARRIVPVLMTVPCIAPRTHAEMPTRPARMPTSLSRSIPTCSSGQ